MKTPFAHFVLNVGLAAVLSSVVAKSAAQTPPPAVPPSTTARESASPSEEQAAQKRVDHIEFRDASISEAVAFLTKKFPEASVIVPPSVADTHITLRLRSATLLQALRAITLASEGRVLFNQEDENFYSFMTGPTYVSDTRACRVYNLAHYLEAKKGDEKAVPEFYDAIRTAAAMLNKANSGELIEVPQLELHQPTRLLIAVGTKRQLEIVSQIANALGGTEIGPGLPPPSSKVVPPGVPGSPGASNQHPGKPNNEFLQRPPSIR